MDFATPFDINTAINLGLLGILLAILGGIITTRSLLAAILLMSVYSLVSVVWLVIMDAVDVAFTEAVVGAGISTIVLLGAILLTRSEALHIKWQDVIGPAAAVLATGALLLYAAIDLPALGDPSSPANAYVGRLYIEHTPHEIGVPNIVTAVLSSYRGFDTLGETTVIFAAGIAVTIMLGFGERSLSDLPADVRAPNFDNLAESDHHVILRVAAKMLAPVTILYALYVQFHGDLGAGGGFQAGVVVAVAVILHALVFGLRDTMHAIRPEVTRGVSAVGVLIYAGVGVIGMLNGGVFLDYDHLFPVAFESGLPGSHLSGGHHHWGQHFGIMFIELGVLATVSSTLITVFYAFAGRSSDAEVDIHAAHAPPAADAPMRASGAAKGGAGA
ncbi:MAG: DUF4040 domain-containing protein [Hyphomonadaceae bacterium]